MTEAEALMIIAEQFTGSSGFLRKLQRGEGVDYEAIEHIRQALNALQRLWANSPDIWKSGVLPLVDIHSSIIACTHLYPNQQAEIQKLAGDLSHQVEKVFLAQPTRMSEEEAAALVYGHFSGLPSLSLTLHSHGPIDEEWIEELLQALKVVAQAWAHRDRVPKAIVGPMLEGGSLIRGYKGVYPNLQDHWETLADEITSEVKRCLS